MRLLTYLHKQKIKEDGATGGSVGGGTTTNNIAVFAPKLTLASRYKRRRVREIKKSKLLG